MKIVIDCSNLHSGGGIQVAISFINDLRKLDLQNEYHIVLSPNLSKQLNTILFDKRFYFYYLDIYTYESIFKRRRFVQNVENQIVPNVIFTVFGPSYHKSKFPKVVGFAYGHILYQKSSPFFKIIGRKENTKHWVKGRLKEYFFIRNSDVLIFETADARKIFSTFINKRKRIFTYSVSNTLNSVFLDPHLWEKIEAPLNIGIFNILYVTANYPHKNLGIIPLVIDAMISRNIQNFKFLITCTKQETLFDDKYDNYITYLGRVDLEKLPFLYDKSSVVFMPTLLETFSVTYIEAMFMGKPIVASDLGFARDICANAAIYCSPLDADEYARAFERLYNDDQLGSDLVVKGYENLKRFGSSMDRTKSYLKILKDHALL